MIRFAEKLQVVPLRAPAATSDSFNTYAVAMKNAHWLSFLVQWGAIDNGTTAAVTFKVYSSTSTGTGSTNSADTALPFSYRLSSAVAADSWGTITSVAAATGVAITKANTGRVMIIEVDPSNIPGLDSDATHVYLEAATVADHATDAAIIFDVIAVLEPRYPQNANLTST